MLLIYNYTSLRSGSYNNYYPSRRSRMQHFADSLHKREQSHRIGYLIFEFWKFQSKFDLLLQTDSSSVYFYLLQNFGPIIVGSSSCGFEFVLSCFIGQTRRVYRIEKQYRFRRIIDIASKYLRSLWTVHESLSSNFLIPIWSEYKSIWILLTNNPGTLYTTNTYTNVYIQRSLFITTAWQSSYADVCSIHSLYKQLNKLLGIGVVTEYFW